MMRIENIPETKRNIEIQLQNAVKRPVSASFSHLGKHKTHSIAIQTTLFEIDKEATGPTKMASKSTSPSNLKI